jgi:AcrR family transcriptional regulator
MTDVAAELRLSPGALYGFAENKEALFHWCIEAAVDPAVLDGVELPLPAAGAAVTLERVRLHLDRLISQEGALSGALATRHPKDAGLELAEVIGELYDATFQSRRLQAIIERSALEMPELFDAFYLRMRRPVIDVLTTYVQARVDEGYFRQVVDVAATARLILETQSWFARHRRGDPDSADIDDAAARATVIDVLSHGVLAERVS